MVLPGRRGTSREDVRQLRLYFPFGWDDIPPHDPAFEQVKSITIDREAHLYSFTPHMHFRGNTCVFMLTTLTVPLKS